MPNKRNAKTENEVKAGALLCPNCCAELQEVNIDAELDGRVLRNVRILRCSICQEEIFTQQQLREAIRKSEKKS